MTGPRHVNDILPAAVQQITDSAEGKITLELPFPPSVNHYWGERVVKPRRGKPFVQKYIAEAGKKFRQAVYDEFLVQNIRTKLRGPLACTVDLYPPDNRRRDHDNYGKALFDALGAAGLYDDDSQVIDNHTRLRPKAKPGRVVITLWEISAPQSAHNQIDLLEA